MSPIYRLSKEESEKMEKRGIDYDLDACLEYNPQDFTIFDIEKVLAIYEGEHDEEDWRWVIKVNKECAAKNGGRFVFLQGGCDYTGWDCQSWASSQFTKTAKAAAKLALGELKLGKSSPVDAGLGHMLNIMSGTYTKNFRAVYDSLMTQLASNKKKTWREAKDDEFGTKSLPKL